MDRTTPADKTAGRSWPGRLLDALRAAWQGTAAPPHAPGAGGFSHKVLTSPRPDPLPARPGEPVLVETGSFRVDVSRMLEKLRDYQLGDPGDFILAWLRCACASGAKRIALDPTEDGLVLTFDGRPFSREELDGPYGALLDSEAAEALRGRHFAYGLLGVQRLKPDRLLVSSGIGEDRAMLLMDGSEQAPAGGLPEPGRDTVFRVSWRRMARPDIPALLKKASSAFGLAQAGLTVKGAALPREPWLAGPQRSDNWRPVDRDGWKGAVRHFVPEPRELPSATVHIYVLGTRIQTLMRHQYSALEAYLACDNLPLDLSQTKVSDPEKMEQAFRVL